MIIRRTRKRFWLAAGIGLFIFYYTLRQANLRKLIENFGNIDPIWAAMVVLASGLSYICIAAVLDLLLRGSGHRLSFSTVFKISLLSCTLNYVMAIGGLSGVAAKVYLLSREKIPPSRTLSISMVHGFLTNTVAVIFIYLGFFYLYSQYKMSSRQIEVGILILLIAFLLTWVTIRTIIQESFRIRLWQRILGATEFICRKLNHPQWLHQERAGAFFENFNSSMTLLVQNARLLVAPAGFALLDWVLMFLCLKFAFIAVHYPVDTSTLMVGFSVGIFASIFSVTPAGIGLMEGSMAGSFYLMGLEYDEALLATLIFRLAYYFVPIIGSLFFYRRFFPSIPDKADADRSIDV